MMILSTIPVAVKNTNNVRVYWSTGMRKHGVVTVDVKQQKDREIIAELAAIRYLVFDKKVFDRRPVGGSGYQLRVYSGAVKKLAQRRSEKPHLVAHALFLSRSFSGVNITVMKQKVTDPLFGTVDTWIYDCISLPGSSGQAVQEHWSTAIGPLCITQHAIEQFEKRLNLQNRDPLANPVASLLRALNVGPERFVRVRLPAKARLQKALKYDQKARVEHWKDIRSGLHLSVARENPADPGTLLTCFYRSAVAA